jgi:hypothetical protein
MAKQVISQKGFVPTLTPNSFAADAIRRHYMTCLALAADVLVFAHQWARKLRLSIIRMDLKRHSLSAGPSGL